VKLKAQPRVNDVAIVKGLHHNELAERCPDKRTHLPTEPCTNVLCPWSIEGEPYMNCSFVVYEAVGQTAKKLSLEEIGVMEGLTREGVRQIEKRALRKIHLNLTRDLPNDDGPPHASLCGAQPSAMLPHAYL
jgi:hypothetical protein